MCAREEEEERIGMQFGSMAWSSCADAVRAHWVGGLRRGRKIGGLVYSYSFTKAWLGKSPRRLRIIRYAAPPFPVLYSRYSRDVRLSRIGRGEQKVGFIAHELSLLARYVVVHKPDYSVTGRIFDYSLSMCVARGVVV